MDIIISDTDFITDIEKELERLNVTVPIEDEIDSLRDGRDKDVCSRQRVMIDTMCPYSKLYPKHTNTFIEYDTNSCQEKYYGYKWILNDDVKIIRIMKEFYRKCAEARTTELELDCGKYLTSYHTEGHTNARDKTVKYKNECNNYINIIRCKLDQIKDGKQHMINDPPKPSKFLHIAQLITNNMSFEYMDKYFDQIIDNKKRSIQLAIYHDMTKEHAEEIIKNNDDEKEAARVEKKAEIQLASKDFQNNKKNKKNTPPQTKKEKNKAKLKQDKLDELLMEEYRRSNTKDT